MQGSTQGGNMGPCPESSPYDMGPLYERAQTMAGGGQSFEGILGDAKRYLVGGGRDLKRDNGVIW